MPVPLLKFLYPRPYWAAIQRYSRKYQVDPYLVLALIREESQFDPLAQSRTYDKGLMQLRPQIAQDVARRLGLKWSTIDLNDPEINNLKMVVDLVVHKQGNNHPYYAI